LRNGMPARDSETDPAPRSSSAAPERRRRDRGGYDRPVAQDDTRSFLVRAVAGADAARNALLERVRPRLVLWAGARLSPALRAWVEPEDVAQDVLMDAHRRLDAFQGTEVRAFYAWLFKIAENRIRDLFDRQNAKKRQPVPPPLTFTQTSPSVRAARSETLARVLAAVESLPEDYRQVLQLRRLEEQDVEQVAQVMGRSENAVRILYCRALQALRESLRNAGVTGSEGSGSLGSDGAAGPRRETSAP
jgi:RNA polymerase sigma-70 factor (ECF subfamily)